MKIITALLTIIIATSTVNASLNKSIANRESYIIENISRDEASNYFSKLNNYNRLSINQWRYQYTKDKTTFSAGYDMTLDQYNKVNRHIKWWIKSNRVKNKREMVLKIRQYLSGNMEYDYQQQDSAYTQYGAYKGLANCQGMSLYAKDFFDEIKIGNRIIKTDHHGWNEILLDGKRYEIDFTIECQWGELQKGIKYDIFRLER